MAWRWRLLICVLGAWAGLAGCGEAGGILNPSFVAVLSGSDQAASVPGNAPGIVIYVHNQTDRWATMTISYRDQDGSVQQYTTTLNPGDKSGQLRLCPIEEITLGSVADLREVGVRVGASTGARPADLASAAVIEVEPFGVLLRDQVNYLCGDSLTFVVRPSTSRPSSASGFETLVYFRYGSGG
ncbi:MAG: hypothetical protein IPM13_12565 [Phycisphaerales bacterium]|nr:hypothetical protein [Phycisphaerales bacterium]